MNSKKITCLAIIISVFLACVCGLIIVDMPITSLICAFMIPVFGFKKMMLIRACLVTLAIIFRFHVILTGVQIINLKVMLVFIACLYGMGWAYTIGFYFMFKKRLIY